MLSPLAADSAVNLLPRWNLSKVLPPLVAVVCFGILSTWQQYQWYVVAGLALFALQIGLILILIVRMPRAKQSEEAVREREPQFALLGNAAGILIWASRENRTSPRLNSPWLAEYASLFGYTKEDVPDIDHWSRVAFPDESYRNEIKAAWQARVQEAVTNLSAIDPMKTRIRCKDGSVREVEFCFSCMGDINVVTFFDYSKREQPQYDRTGSPGAFAPTNRIESNSQMVAALVHELAQPLASILSNAQAAERFASHPEPDLNEIREALADITEDDRRARAVIQNMRAAFQKNEIAPRELDLNQLVNNVHRMTKADARQQAVQVRLVLSPTPIYVFGEAGVLEQALLNLINNGIDAMKYTPSENKVLTVTTAMETSTDCGIILVEDSGKGIEEEDKPRLFIPFFTTKSDGLGMGLPISRSLVELLGGSITLEERSKPGAAFRVSLPLAARAKALTAAGAKGSF